MSRLDALAQPIRQALAAPVVALFNDAAKGERPVAPRPDGLFGPASVTWRVHGDVTAMMVGGVTGLLLQMLHPQVLAGVWDHSRFREDMHGRLRRTARFIALTTYGGREEAEAVIARVRAIHARVAGTLPDGTPYRADDPALLAWVHVTEVTSFLSAYRRYAEPAMSRRAQDAYVAEMARIGRAVGADPVPEDLRGAEALLRRFRPSLRADARSREVARLVLSQRPASGAVAPFQALALGAGVDLLPPWARRMHGLPEPAAAPLVRAGTFGLAGALRWAFRRG